MRERFAAVVSAETALGCAPELEKIAIVRSTADLACLAVPQVDYLEPLIWRYAEALPQRDA
ncbi:MAG: hypothetical protein ACRDTF_14905 [Pseudonocardiaceae bacterium]